MTTNKDINDVLLPLKQYGGIYNDSNINTLKFKSLPCYIICNHDESKGDGTHWISIIFSKNNVFYFDSFGEHCRSKNILSVMKRYRYKNYYFNKKIIQHPFSNLCGHYAIGCVLFLKNGNSFHDYIKMFKKRLLHNDKIIKDYLDSLSIEINTTM